MTKNWVTVADLSALMDGELTEERQQQVIQAVKQDPELRAIWQRLHIASDIIRDDHAIELDEVAEEPSET